LFRGTLDSDHGTATVNFRVTIDRKGALSVAFGKIRLSRKTSFLLTGFDADEDRHYKLTGVSHKDEARFACDHLYVTSLGTKSFPDRPAEMRPKIECFSATLNWPGHRIEKTFLRYRLAGFESFPRLAHDCPLGRIYMGGPKDAPKTGEATGFLNAEMPAAAADAAEWHRETKALFDHILTIMDFATGLHLKRPFEEFAQPGAFEVVTTAQTDLARSDLPTIHMMERQRIFERAIDTFFADDHVIKKLDMALAWFSADAPHDEIRFFNAVTAIENIVDIMLAPDERAVLPKAQFEKLRKHLRQTVRAQKIEGKIATTIFEKMGDLNRLSLKEKIAILIGKNQIPIAGIGWPRIQQALQARNRVVHTGRYWDGERKGRGDLWEHIVVMRELAVRIFLTVLGFEGRYISLLDGYHLAQFPPQPPD
jgi:hypothetical protein